MATITQYIEALTNPYGRFRTLRNMIVSCDMFGNPSFSVHCDVADFRIEVDGKLYLLKCPLDNRGVLPVEMLDTVARWQRADPDNRYLVPYTVLEKEILLFDELDRSRYADVMLMEIPEGETLDSYLLKACDAGNREALKELAGDFCRMAMWLLFTDLPYGRIVPRNVYVGRRGDLKLLHYEKLAGDVSHMISGRKERPYMPVAGMVMVLYILSCNPDFYRLFDRYAIFNLTILRNRVLDKIYDAVESGGNKPLRGLMALLINPEDAPAGAGYVAALFNRMLEVGVDTEICKEGVSAREKYNASANKDKVSFDVSRYDWVGACRDGLMAVNIGAKWGYVDMAGREVLPLRYDWADDFSAGRAVVLIDDTYTLIDTEGNFIMPLRYEDMSWNAATGTVKMMYDGLWGLADSDGNEIMAPAYDRMGDLGEALIAVNDGVHTGFVNSRGKIVVPLIYDEVTDFVGGSATVVKDGSRMTVTYTPESGLAFTKKFVKV